MKDLLLEYLGKHNIPATRENYVSLGTLGDKDGKEPLDAEEEAELPEDLQHPNFKEEEKE